MSKLWQDFVRFSGLHVRTGDIDPVYPVLTELTAGMPEEEALEMVFLYVAHYDLPSMMVRKRGGDPYKCGTERRGFRRHSCLIKHLEALDKKRQQWGGFGPWLRSELTGDPGEDWKVIQLTLTQPWGNGGWAAWKTAEILQKALGWPLVPSTLGLDNAFGPRQGVEFLYPALSGDPDWDHIEAAGRDAADRLEDQLEERIDLAMVETCFCDFASMIKGRYYVGHDLDQMAARIHEEREMAAADKMDMWAARRRSFGMDVLVEAHGTPRERTARATVYRDTGVIIPPWEVYQMELDV